MALNLVEELADAHADEVLRGIADDDLFDRLAGPIEEARREYEACVGPEIVVNHNHFERALVDVLLGRSGHVRSEIW